MVINAIPSGILQLMKCHSERPNLQELDPNLFVNGINIKSHKCTNKHIRNYFYSKRKISPQENLFGTLYILTFTGNQHGFYHTNLLSQTK